MNKLWRKGITDLEVLGREMGRTARAIEMKLKRLGVVVRQEFSRTTTTAIKSRDLFQDPGLSPSASSQENL